jgi:hypothetical protein
LTAVAAAAAIIADMVVFFPRERSALAKGETVMREAR